MGKSTLCLAWEERIQGYPDIDPSACIIQGSDDAVVDGSYNFSFLKVDEFVKSPKTVMPDLIRHPEPIEITGFRVSPE